MAGPKLTVDEASEAYVDAMRNPAPPQLGVCSICRTFVAPSAELCAKCRGWPNHLDAVVPITYSVHGQQMHTALWTYKNAAEAAQRFPQVRLGAILWRFLRGHGTCVAAAAGIEQFDSVCVVPSSTPAADEARSNLRELVSWCDLISDRTRRLLFPTGRAESGHRYDPARFKAAERLDGQHVLMVEDTWTTGARAQSAAFALREAGAARIALIVIGRHIRPNWEITPTETCQDRWKTLPERFDWESCAVHSAASGSPALFEP